MLKLFAALMVLLLGTLAAAAQEVRVALVIGNADYSDATPLKNPVNDATDLAAALERQVGDVPDRETDAADAMKFDPPLCRGDRLGRRVEAVERGEETALRGEKLEPATAAVEREPGALTRDRQLAEQVEQPVALARSPRDERLDVLGNQQARVGPADAARRRSL